MKESTKGALLSALVYPGLGQLVLGAKVSGAFFAVLTTTGLVVIFYRLTIRLYRALDQILPELTGRFEDLRKVLTIMDQSTYPSWSGEIISLVVVLPAGQPLFSMPIGSAAGSIAHNRSAAPRPLR